MCTLWNAWDFPYTVACFTPKIRCPVSPKEGEPFLGFCTDGGCFAFSKRCSPDLGFSPLPGAGQKEEGGFLFSDPGRNSSECQGFFTCSVDSTRVCKLHDISENRQPSLLPSANLTRGLHWNARHCVKCNRELYRGRGCYRRDVHTDSLCAKTHTRIHNSCPICAVYS